MLYNSLYIHECKIIKTDGILRLLDKEKVLEWDEKARVEIFEASHLGVEDECLFETKNTIVSSRRDRNSGKGPSHRNVSWFNVRRYVHESDESPMTRLAGLSFNTIQVQHQKDLKDILRCLVNI